MRVCVSVCVCMFIHMFLQVSLTVCVSESLLCLLWHPGLCLSVCHGKRVNVVWCVCVCFDVGVEPPRANGDTAAAIYPNTSQEFSGWITRKDERGG